MEPTEKDTTQNQKEQFLLFTEMSMELFQKLRMWCSEGDRSVEIKMKNSQWSEDYFRIFIYDHDTQDGQHISHVDDIPDRKEVLQRQLHQAKERVAKLKIELKKE